ncbi:hypothetical protein V1478_000314 [Vespula squamosa]|uniref:Uncharacterized protein n=1 Tax=Vespula squamosa TaxID=30214 RepID=A0ABD2C545_VESSQ
MEGGVSREREEENDKTEEERRGGVEFLPLMEERAPESAATATNSTTPTQCRPSPSLQLPSASSAAASSSRQPLPQIGNSRIHFPFVDSLRLELFSVRCPPSMIRDSSKQKPNNQ